MPYLCEMCLKIARKPRYRLLLKSSVGHLQCRLLLRRCCVKQSGRCRCFLARKTNLTMAVIEAGIHKYELFWSRSFYGNSEYSFQHCDGGSLSRTGCCQRYCK